MHQSFTAHLVCYKVHGDAVLSTRAGPGSCHRLCRSDDRGWQRVQQADPPQSADRYGNSSGSTKIALAVCGTLYNSKLILHRVPSNSCIKPNRSVMSWQVEQVTAEELEVAIQNRDRPLVIDFFATWCGPCLLLAKELEQVSSLTPADSYIIAPLLKPGRPALSAMHLPWLLSFAGV